MSTEIDENDYSLQTKKQRIGRKRECCWMCAIEDKMYKLRKIHDTAQKRAGKIVLECIKKTFSDLPQNEDANCATFIPGIDKIYIDHFDFDSDTLDMSGLNKFERKIVCDTMRVLKANKIANTLEKGHLRYSTDAIVWDMEQYNKQMSKHKARRDLESKF